VNFRDVGGYPTADGRRVRWGLLFRSDSLQWLSSSDLELLVDDLGVKTLIDLRGEGERDRGPVPPVPRDATVLHHVPAFGNILDAVEGESAPLERIDDLATMYSRTLLVSGPQFAKTFEILSGDAALPAVYFCSSGKDRSGVLTAVVLSLLGVRDEDIVADYALSERSIETLVKRIRAEYPNLDEEWKHLPREQLLDVVAPAMSAALESLRASFGSAENYLVHFGLAKDAISEVRKRLLE
jgi:protein-tyrosine phosphatase